jgi:hypothetical protein
LTDEDLFFGLGILVADFAIDDGGVFEIERVHNEGSEH